MTQLLCNMCVVLHQVRSPDNLGAVARVMANFGCTRLVLSEPFTYAFRAAEKLAVKSQHVLDELHVAESLREALGGVVYACGTTSRKQVDGREVLTPEDAIRRLSGESTRGRVALVFGGERRGLSDSELAVCQDVLAIPTGEGQPSMNLAQAAAVLLYLASRVEGRSTDPAPAEDAAPLRLLHELEVEMKAALLGAGYLNPQAPDYVLRELLASLGRGQVSRREAELWIGAFRHLGRTARVPARPRRSH